jgi:hypothetical protein
VCVYFSAIFHVLVWEDFLAMRKNLCEIFHFFNLKFFLSRNGTMMMTRAWIRLFFIVRNSYQSATIPQQTTIFKAFLSLVWEREREKLQEIFNLRWNGFQ